MTYPDPATIHNDFYPHPGDRRHGATENVDMDKPITKFRFENGSARRIAVSIEPWAVGEFLEPEEQIMFECEDLFDLEIACLDQPNATIWVRESRIVINTKGDARNSFSLDSR